jgi:hypothetical protein
MVTRVLRIGGNYLGIIYIVYIRVLYRLIDFAQETRRGSQAREEVDLIILLEDLEYKQLKK